MPNYLSALQAAKRNVFFSFHYTDIMRVNNVRKSGEFKTEDQSSGRSIEGFYDRSLWESRKTNGPDSIKHLIREGVDRTSAICVLIGTNTWQRRWVRYEIARSVVDGRGLLGVHINGLRHHQSPYQPHKWGDNPLKYLGLARKKDGMYYLCERTLNAQQTYVWTWYKDYTFSVLVPDYMPSPAQGVPIRLSEYTTIHDWMQDGHNLIGEWIDAAAQAVGR